MKTVLKFCFVILLFSDSSLYSQISLVSNGKTDFTIIIPSENNSQERDAATLMQKVIDSMTGVTLPIQEKSSIKSDKSIIISTKPFSPKTRKLAIPHPDGFYITSDKKSLIIYGGNKRGAVHGVVHFLGKYLDCRMYAPHYSVFPKKNQISIHKINEYLTPDNHIRIINGDYVHQSKEYRDWLMTNEISEEFPNGYFVHTFHKLLPTDEYFDQHPEYFSMVNGKRTRDQLCMSNPDVLRLTIRKLRLEMSKQPEKNLWSVSQNDNPFYCSCDRCSAIIQEENAPSGPLIRFINAVADTFPDKEISTLAYQFSRKAPAITKPRKNVQVMLCTIELNRSKAIAEDPGSASFVKDIKDWSAITDHIFLWDYTVDFAHQITPFPNFHVLQPNIRFFYDHAAKIQFQQSNVGKGHAFSELKAYVISRLLWDTKVNKDSVINDFLNGYYGKAAPFIRKYMDKTESELIKSGQFLDIYGHPTGHQNSFLSQENVQLYNKWFDEAENSVLKQPVYLNHVKTARLPLMYAMMEIGKSDMFSPRGFYSIKGENLILKPEMSQMVDYFLQICTSNGVKNVNESGLTPSAYIQSTRRTLKIKKEGNLAFGKNAILSPMPATKYSSGSPALLTNGVHGSNDYRVHWLGWEGIDFEISLDLVDDKEIDSIQISTLYLPNSWVLHPKGVTCTTYDNNDNPNSTTTIDIQGDQKNEEVNKTFNFVTSGKKVKKIKINVTSSAILPHWHPAYGGTAWTFVDELVVYGKK